MRSVLDRAMGGAMEKIAVTLLLALIVSTVIGGETASVVSGPQFTADSQLKFPQDYRKWVYLSSGIDMNYGPVGAVVNHSIFDNVFVNPDAYNVFLKTGTWPDGTALVLENRGAESKGSINHSGHFQGSDVTGLEVHVKDEKRFPGKWAFFVIGGRALATMVPPSASCYSCHAEHAAVDTTFVQFYPTLLTVAKDKGTLSSAYKKEESLKSRR